jgi:hypothetical protein
MKDSTAFAMYRRFRDSVLSHLRARTLVGERGVSAWLLEELSELRTSTTPADALDALLDMLGIIILALQAAGPAEVYAAYSAYLESQRVRGRTAGPHAAAMTTLMEALRTPSDRATIEAIFKAKGLAGVWAASRPEPEAEPTGTITIPGTRLTLGPASDDVPFGRPADWVAVHAGTGKPRNVRGSWSVAATVTDIVGWQTLPPRWANSTLTQALHGELANQQALIIIAPTASGKSYLVKRDPRFLDGDDIIEAEAGWPAGPWWRDMLGNLVTARNAEIIARAAFDQANAKRAILFNGLVHPSVVSAAVIIPIGRNEQQLGMRLEQGERTPSTNASLDEMRENRLQVEQFALKFSIPVFDSFDNAMVALRK